MMKGARSRSGQWQHFLGQSPHPGAGTLCHQIPTTWQVGWFIISSFNWLIYTPVCSRFHPVRIYLIIDFHNFFLNRSAYASKWFVIITTGLTLLSFSYIFWFKNFSEVSSEEPHWKTLVIPQLGNAPPTKTSERNCFPIKPPLFVL